MKEIKKIVAATSWTAAVLAAIARTFLNAPPLTVWAILAAALAATASAALVVDHVAERCSKYVIAQVKAERAATMDATVSAIHKSGIGTADKIVERLASKQDKTLERMVDRLAGALREDGVTRLR